MTGHVVVVGGGATGLSTAWWLRRDGVAVTVVEKGIVGWEASGRNGGGATHAVSPLFAEEQRLWPMMDELLGYPTEYQRLRLRIGLSRRQLALIMEGVEVARAQGFVAHELDNKALRELVPFVAESAAGGVLLEYGGHANPQRTMQAYAWALQDLGGVIQQHTTVTGFETNGGRISGVRTSQGLLGCDAVVLAAGPHTAQLAAMLGVRVPVASARAEMIVTEPLPLIQVGGADGNGVYPPAPTAIRQSARSSANLYVEDLSSLRMMCRSNGSAPLPSSGRRTASWVHVTALRPSSPAASPPPRPVQRSGLRAPRCNAGGPG